MREPAKFGVTGCSEVDGAIHVRGRSVEFRPKQWWTWDVWAVVRDGEIVASSDYGFPQREPSEEEEAEILRLASETTPPPFLGGPFYLCFNDLPEGGASTNHATGEREAGVSVYGAAWDPVEGAYAPCGEGLPGAAWAYLVDGAPIYLVRGRRVGTGSDYEPVISGAEVVCELEHVGGMLFRPKTGGDDGE